MSCRGGSAQHPAWNQRYFVLQNTADLKQADVVRGEVAYATLHQMAPNRSMALPEGRHRTHRLPFPGYACPRRAAPRGPGAAGTEGQPLMERAARAPGAPLVDILNEEGTISATATALCGR